MLVMAIIRLTLARSNDGIVSVPPILSPDERQADKKAPKSKKHDATTRKEQRRFFKWWKQQDKAKS